MAINHGVLLYSQQDTYGRGSMGADGVLEAVAQMGTQGVEILTDGVHRWTLALTETVTSFGWEYADKATVRVVPPLAWRQARTRSCCASARVADIPVPFSGEMTRTATV